MKRTTLLAATLLLTLAALATGCEKSDQAIIQEQYREASNLCPKGCDDPPPGCSIKGNIGSTGLKFYLVPDHPLWEAAIIEPAKGERWFCNAREAQDNGFQAPPSGN